LRGDNAEGQQNHFDALQLAQELGDKLLIVESLDGLARSLLQDRRTELATMTCATGEYLRERAGVERPANAEARFLETRARCRAESSDGFDLAVEAAKRTSLDQLTSRIAAAIA
ncbi:MAG: hypothetical protein ACRDGS_16185, partial [Chloroflexota bacterium]